MQPDRQKHLYNAFDPMRSLAPDEPYNVDIDAVNPGARGLAWADRLVQRIALSDRPVQLFFSGLPGSGKSTELRRMAALLEGPQHRFTVARIDAKDCIDLQAEVDVPDLLLSLVHGAERVVIQQEVASAVAPPSSSYLGQLWGWLTQTDRALGTGEWTVPDGPSLVGELQLRPRLRERLRATLNGHLKRFLDEARAALEALDARARATGSSGGLLVVFDSLEKLRGTSSSFRSVLDSAEKVFDPNAPWFDLPVPVVWTVPAALVTSARLQVEFLPMIKLTDRLTGEPASAGRAAMQAIVGRRADPADREALMGPDHEAALLLLIDASGGYVRDLLRLLQELTLLGRPADNEDLLRSIALLHDEVLRIVPTGAYPWLARVGREKGIATRDEAEQRIADRMLTNNVVLRYQNREPWFDLHPAMRRVDLEGEHFSGDSR